MEIGQRKRVNWVRYCLEGKYYPSRYAKCLYIIITSVEDELSSAYELPTHGSWIGGWEDVWE